MNETKTIIKEFIELVKTDAASKNERKIADIVKQKLKQLGCEVEEDNTADIIGGNAGNIIAKIRGDKALPTILFSAHMDRVDRGFNINPEFTDDGRIVSEGNTILAADDVAGIVSILDGIRKIKEENIKHGNIEIVFTVCEEKGILGSKYLDYSKLDAKIGYVLDSSGRIGRIINQGPSKKNINVKVCGKSAHAGNEPEKGINAIKVAAIALAELKEGRLNKHTTSNFGVIKGGRATNVVCDFVEIEGEVRSTQKKDLDLYINEVRKVFNKAAEKFKTKVKIEIDNTYETFKINEAEQVIKLLKEAMKATGVEYYFSSGGGGMDANRFNKEGIRTVGLATGYSNNHTFKEEIFIEDLIKSGELVKNLIAAAAKS